MLKISSAFIIIGSITLASFAVPAKSEVFQPQTVEEMLFAEAHGFEMLPESPVFTINDTGVTWWVRNELPRFLLPPLEGPKWMEPAVHTTLWDGIEPGTRVKLVGYTTGRFMTLISGQYVRSAISSESPEVGQLGDPPLPVHMASWQGPVPVQPAPCTGVCVTYSSQGAAALRALTGKRIKGFQLVQATTCADHDTKFGAGRIIQQANAMGIQTLSAKSGAAVVQQTVDLNWRRLLLLGVQVGTSVALGVTTSGVVASSKAITTGIALGHIALDELPNVLKPGTPNPDPFLSSALDESGQVSISAGSCVSAMFAGTWDLNSPRVTGKIQLLP